MSNLVKCGDCESAEEGKGEENEGLFIQVINEIKYWDTNIPSVITDWQVAVNHYLDV